MHLPRISISRLMAIVAVVAINVAVGRAVFEHDPEILIGVALLGLAIQGAIVAAFRAKRGRAFWVGFAVLGAAAIGSFAWGMTLPEELIAVAVPGQPSRLVNVGTMSVLWLDYGSFVADRLEPVLLGLGMDPNIDPNGPTAVAIRGLVWALPQLAAALAGGAGAWGIMRIAGTRRRAVLATGGAG